ncbi:hypothetical protein AO240_05280 [Pseudomonas sp. ICMP 460]|nr:hypothetical protein AO240_05280 [Pseudomonas sp. ICMP 460]
MRSSLKNYPFHIRSFKHKPAIKTAKYEVMPEEINKAWPDHFSYIDTIGPEGMKVHCIIYQVIGETAQLAPGRSALRATIALLPVIGVSTSETSAEVRPSRRKS